MACRSAANPPCAEPSQGTPTKGVEGGKESLLPVAVARDPPGPCPSPPPGRFPFSPLLRQFPPASGVVFPLPSPAAAALQAPLHPARAAYHAFGMSKRPLSPGAHGAGRSSLPAGGDGPDAVPSALPDAPSPVLGPVLRAPFPPFYEWGRPPRVPLLRRGVSDASVPALPTSRKGNKEKRPKHLSQALRALEHWRGGMGWCVTGLRRPPPPPPCPTPQISAPPPSPPDLSPLSLPAGPEGGRASAPG